MKCELITQFAGIADAKDMTNLVWTMV